MTTEFKVGELVECIDRTPALGGEIPPERGEVSGVGDGFLKIGQSIWWRTGRFRRASESQREGGFGWTEEARNETHVLWHHHDGGEVVAPIDEPPERDWPHYSPQTFQLGRRGFRWLRGQFGCDGAAAGYVPADSYEERLKAVPPEPPPQPAPMTRAARVLAKMMGDPYKVQYELDGEQAAEAVRRNEAARLRMAKMQLDDELTYDQTRWRKLVLAKVPTGRR